MKKVPAPSTERGVAQVSPLRLYLAEIGKYPLLTPEQEWELARQHFDEGDIDAAHRLITSNLRLVVKIANDFRRAQINFLDLIQEGNFGLMQAVKKFNPYKGVKLSSYAAWWIRAYILKYLMDHRSQVKIATTAAQRKLFYNLAKETERLLGEYDRVDAKLIASSLKVPEKDVIEMQKRLATNDVSLDAPNDDTGERNRLDSLASAEEEELETRLANAQLREIFAQDLEQFQASLEGRDKDIFERRMLAEQPQTLAQIGDEFGISRERARQLEARLLQKLKDFVAARGVLNP